MSHRDLRQKIRRETKGRSPADEIRILESYLRDWPEYKGPYQELRKKYEARLAELHRVLNVRAGRGAERDPFAIRKRGVASVALVGLPSSGKSRLASSLSGMDLETAEYPFTTLTPNVVMMKLGKAVFELIDLPAVAEQPLQELSYASGISDAVRNATLLGIVIDLTSDISASLRTVEARLEEAGVSPAYSPPDPEESLGERRHGAVLLGTRMDQAGERALSELAALRPGSVAAGHPLGSDGPLRTGEAFCRLLRMMLVTARDPSAPEEPVIYAVSEGATVRDLADRIHHELARRVKRAKVWGKSAAFDGQEVGPDHELRPRDVVELY